MAEIPKAFQDFIKASVLEGDDIARHIMDSLETYKPGVDKNSAAVAFGCLTVAGCFLHGVPLEIRQGLMPAFIECFKEYAGTKDN